jgi:hypothetical protein
VPIKPSKLTSNTQKSLAIMLAVLRGNRQRLFTRGLSTNAYAELRSARAGDIGKLPEVQQRVAFEARLRSGQFASTLTESALRTPVPRSLTSEQCRTLLLAGFSSFQLHVESRISSLLGKGFYTIGPCGEEVGETLNKCMSLARYLVVLSNIAVRYGIAHTLLTDSLIESFHELVL